MNSVLVQRWLDYPRIRLVKNGEVLPPSRYLEYRVGRRGQRISFVDLDRLEKEMRRGSMLHLASLEELHQPVGELALAIQDALRADVFVNAHAGLEESKGFNTHWDGHDVFVLQISGAKRWRMFGTTLKHPLPVAPNAKVGAPTIPVWETILRQGDLLYVPRGFWHSAEALNEPTLHVTIGITSPTGIDFMSWLCQQFDDSGVFRQDIARVEDFKQRENYLERLRVEFVSKMNIDALDTFLERQTLLRKHRKIKLP